ncbi:ATP-binding cassette subfamily G member 4-like isoform X2 [Helicoverpa zea]|uniref:ATP-binding cassette subfamily G member 4-like isoform X2 n=1 Tax=Helicoverpa zea TaxID=7113 RepID=UPI001F562A14|nr:ATP-binding cassette subfamily G member 4-like isoform X2 [Helicoverpa zea]
MSNVPLVRKAIVGAALAHATPSSHPNPMTLDESQESQWTPAALERAGSTLKALNRMAKRPPVHIVFEDVSYTVSSHKGERKILNNISGEFRSGELTCILGPSGAGKSTLLNILAGYNSNGVNGRITVNGHSRDMRVFKKLSTYIMQDDLLQPRLTVQEAMGIAANLKLGKELGKAEKELIVEEILRTLGLWDHRNTMTEKLSGGQLKRLSVALELVNNPPIIFLDEPTTGLDIVSIRQLVVLLRLLSRQGRTIICTVHQPSASLFTLFDKIFVLARGMCCYQGAPQLLVPFMSEAGYICPKTHNPADFVLETLVSDVEAAAPLSELCQNGKLCRRLDRMTTRGGRKPVLHSDESIQRIFTEHVAKDQSYKVEFPTTFWTQFTILSNRMFMQNLRNTSSHWIQFAHHTISAILLGSIFFNVGNNAAIPVVNFKFCMSCLVFFMYTYTMIPVLLFPFQVRLLRREYFNRWYSLKAFYAALTLSSIPSMNGSIVAPAAAAPLLALSCYGMGFGPYIEGSMRALMSASFLRYGVTGFSLALYKNRKLMECKEDFCLYSDPTMILRDLGMESDNFGVQVAGLLAFTLIHRVLAYLALRYRLTAEFSNKFMCYVSKFLKHR